MKTKKNHFSTVSGTRYNITEHFKIQDNIFFCQVFQNSCSSRSLYKMPTNGNSNNQNLKISVCDMNGENFYGLATNGVFS